MSEHTPEPWYLEENDNVLTGADGGPVLFHLPSGSPVPKFKARRRPVRVANMRRIVACVNACKGIPTEDLNGMGVGGILRNPPRLQNLQAQARPDQD